jgi:two-component system phosphate regulon sensor histidine kinase PhoR
LKIRFKNQLLITITVTVFLVLILSITLARSTFSSTLLDSKQQLLASESNYIESYLIEDDMSPIKLDNYASTHNVRVTVIDVEGKPLYDSMVNYNDMENHYYRTEIKSAREGKTSYAVRVSNTTHYNTLYSATYYESSQIYVRTAANIEELNIWDTRFLTQLLPFIIVLAIIILILSFILIGIITRPVQELASAANKYGRGDFSSKTAIEKPYEFARLSSVMNQMADDINEQVNKLTDDRNTYSSILSSMVEGVLVTDGDKRITLCNRASIAMFGLDVTEPISLMGLFSDIKFDTIVTTAMNENKSSRYVLSRFGHLSGETAKIIGDGEDRTYQVIIAPISQRDEVSGSVITFNDISELKHLENVRKDFVSNVSHELKTPLTSIAGFSSILVKEELDEIKSKKYAAIIEKNTLQMKGIIEDLLTLASLEKEDVQIEMRFENIAELIEESIDSCEYKAREKNISIEYKNRMDIDLYCSASLLRQAILNLLTNAIAYSDNNETIMIETSEGDKDYKIQVSDHGVGIPKKEHDRIFERFYRVDKARSKSSGGTGLGLSIVRHIMSLHGGSVSVESCEGLGSTFTLSLLKERVDMSAIKEKSKALYPHF